MVFGDELVGVGYVAQRSYTVLYVVHQNAALVFGNRVCFANLVVNPVVLLAKKCIFESRSHKWHRRFVKQQLGADRLPTAVVLTILLFASYSNLYCLFDWRVVDEDEVTATAGTGNLVAFYLALVFVNGFLYVWRYHIGEHCHLCLE